jgi:putative ABC transport system permease protein
MLNCQGTAAASPAPTTTRKRPPGIGWGEVAWILVIVAAIGAAVSDCIPGEMEVGVFFGSGVLALVTTLTVVWQRLRRGSTGPAVAVGRGNLLRLALRNVARNPGRSGLTIGLVAAACFLIVAMSAFRIDPAQQVPTLDSGNGGFTLVAESDQPLYHDLNTREGRAELGFSQEDQALLARCKVFSLRVKPGDDASCLNLYQPRQPRLLGVPPALIERGGFAWADAPRGEENPWRSLGPVTHREGGEERAVPVGEDAALLTGSPPPPHLGPLSTGERDPAAIPVVLDKNTANYSLHLWKGRGEAYETTDGRGRTLRLKVAGLLSNSIFQGDLLMPEAALLRYDPHVSGYRFFLIETPPETTAGVQAALERTLGDYGFATETTADRLASFLAVQNTYLSTFQSLGGLGLLLGTMGLAAVQLRNVLERRGELALLRAAGFRRALLTRMVMLENVLVLVIGLAAGMLGAIVAILPYLVGRGAQIPWASIGGILVVVLVVGILAGRAAVGALAATPLLTALREDR